VIGLGEESFFLQQCCCQDLFWDLETRTETWEKWTRAHSSLETLVSSKSQHWPGVSSLLLRRLNRCINRSKLRECADQSMSVLVILWRKCTLAALRAAPWWITLSMRRRDRRTDARPVYITLTARRNRHNKSIQNVLRNLGYIDARALLKRPHVTITDRKWLSNTKVRTIVTIGLSLRPIVALSDDYRSR